MHLDAVADELYGLRPQEFTTVRDQRAAAARRAGDRELAEQIKALRRPTLSAWASNLLVREQPDEVEPLIQLGEGLRRAHRDLDGEQLRQLSRRQHALVAAMSRQARELTAAAGHRVSDDVREEIEQTLRAVLADPEAARQWATGRLAKPLSTTPGFKPAEAGPSPSRHLRLVPPPSSAVPRGDRQAAEERQRAKERQRKELAAARREAEQAARELRACEEEAAGADQALHNAQKLAATLRRRITELSEQLRTTEARAREAEADETTTRRHAREADRRLRQARRRATDTEDRVQRLAGEKT